MRVWVVGQRSFGAAVVGSLDALEGVQVIGITAPEDDKAMLAVRELSTYWTLSQSLRASVIQSGRTDLLVSAHSHLYVPGTVRYATVYGAIGYHPSLLPRHRGRSAVEWTVAMRDPIAGGTVYALDRGWDTGPIIKQDWCHVVPDWSASDLWREELFGTGVRLLAETVDDVRRAGLPMMKEQDERVATYEPPWADAAAAAVRRRVERTQARPC